MPDTYRASHHDEWANAGLKDFGDFSDCVEYINQGTEYGDSGYGEWWYEDTEKRTIYGGTFGNSHSPGASHYTWAEVYEDKTEFNARCEKLAAMPEYLECDEEEEESEWQVVVGNIGTVYEGTDEQEARDIYDEYVEQSLTGHGRAAGEEVALFCDGDIEEEHTAETQGMDD